MSGASRSSRVRKNPPDSAKFEVSGPRASVSAAPRFSSVSAVSSEGSSVVYVIHVATWSWRPSPTGSSWTCGMLLELEVSAGPIPLSSRICGLW